jgi:hypothetical protein
VIFRKKFIWSNLLDLLLGGGGCEKVFHLRKSLYGLENLVKQLKSLA